MRSAITQYLPYFMSLCTMTQVWITGNKHRHAWSFGLFCQALWLTWIIASSNWGFLIMNFFMWGLYIRNHFKWNPRKKLPPYQGSI